MQNQIQKGFLFNDGQKILYYHRFPRNSKYFKENSIHQLLKKGTEIYTKAGVGDYDYFVFSMQIFGFFDQNLFDFSYDLKDNYYPVQLLLDESVYMNVVQVDKDQEEYKEVMEKQIINIFQLKDKIIYFDNLKPLFEKYLQVNSTFYKILEKLTEYDEDLETYTLRNQYHDK